jgi:hypothetical protein
MYSALLAPFAKFIELDFALDFLTVLARPVIDMLTFLAGQFDQFIL